MRPLGESTPALLMSTSSRPKRSTARATTASTWSSSLTSASTVSTSPRASGSPATVASSDVVADVAQHDVGVGLAGELRATARRRACRPHR